MSFQTDIEAITGSISSYTTEANSYLVEGVKFITKYVMNNEDMADKLTSSTTLNNSPTTMDTSSALKIVSVTRNDGSRDREAVQVSSEKAGDYTDVNSIYYTSKFDPKWYISNATLNVIPTPANGQSALVKHITPDTSVAVGETSISNFPTELNRGVVLYASQQMLRKFLNVRNTTLVGLSTGLNNISPPSGTSVIADVSYSGPSNSDVGTASAAGVTNSEAVAASATINLGNPPAYNKLSSYSLTVFDPSNSVGSLSFSGINPPSATGISAVTYSGPGNDDVGTIGTVQTSFSTTTTSTGAANVGSAPTYSAPSISGGLASVPSIGDLSISGSAPNAPSVTDITVGNMPSAPAYAPPSLSIDYTAPGNLGVDDYLTDEDVELARLALDKVRTDITKYQSDVQNQANEFNEKMAEHQAGVQKVIRQAELESSESAQKLQKYSAELQEYQTDINKQVQEYQQNTTKDLQVWQQTRATQLEQYQLDIQNQSTVFNSNVEKFRGDNQSALDKVQRDLQASIANAQNDLAEAQNDAQLAQDKETRTHAEKSQRLIQNAINTMQAISADNESKIAGFNSELNKYQALINKEVTEHTTEVQREIQKAELLRGTELSSFNVQIQDELNEFNGQNSNYQVEIQGKLDKVQRDLQANIADAQNDLAAAQATAQMTTDVNIRNHAEKSQRLIQNAIQTMQSIMADNEANLAKYNADIGKYQAEVNEAIQDYTLSLQEVTQDYNWLKDQYAIVSGDLAQFLQPYIPQREVQREVAADDRPS